MVRVVVSIPEILRGTAMIRFCCIVLLGLSSCVNAELRVSTQKPESHFSEGNFFKGMDSAHPVEPEQPIQAVEPEKPTSEDVTLIEEPSSKDRVITLDEVKSGDVDTTKDRSVRHTAPAKKTAYAEPELSAEEKRARKAAKLQAQKAEAERKKQRDLTNAATDRLKEEQAKALEKSLQNRGW
jgi:hypothetical protein